MRTVFLKKDAAPELDLFFCGWGLDESLFTHLVLPVKRDLLFVNQYDACWNLPDLSRYQKVHTVAWSHGVFCAAKVFQLHPEIASGGDMTGFCGSLLPYNAENGLPPAIYDGTAEHWTSEPARLKFYQRVFGRRSSGPALRTPADQKEELICIREVACKTPLPENIQPYKTIYICGADRIFSQAALIHFLSSNNVRIHFLEKATHYPLEPMSSWDDIFV